MKAIEKREKLSQDKKIIGLYDAEKMERYERNCRLAYAEKIGLEKGMEKGMELGANQKQLEIAKNMLKDDFPIETIMKYTNLSLEQLESLK